MNELYDYLRGNIYFELELGRPTDNRLARTVGFLSIDGGEIGRMQNSCERPATTQYRVDIAVKSAVCDKRVDLEEVYKAVGIINEEGNGLLNAVLCKDSPFYAYLQKESIRYQIDTQREADECYITARVTFSLESVISVC